MKFDFFSNKGIKFKIITSITLLFLLIFFLTLFFTIQKSRGYLLEEMERNGRTTAEVVLKTINTPMSQGDSESIEASFTAIKKGTSGLDFFITNNQAKITWSTDINDIGKDLAKKITNTELKSVLKDTLKTGKYYNKGFAETFNGQPYFTLVKPILNEKSCYECHDQGEKVLGAFFSSQSVAETEDQIAQLTLASTLLGILGIIVTAVALYFLSSLLVITPLKKVVDILKDISEGEGDLTARIKTTGKDEINELAEYFNNFIQKVQEVVIEVKKSSDNVNSSSRNISGSSEGLLMTMGEQSSQSQSIANAIQELSVTSADIAKLIDSTQTDLENSTNLTRDGGKVIESSIDSLRSIQEQTGKLQEIINHLGISTGKIGNIIDVINDVADQTNLLALNAAIEAARAGDAGKGFAVVADEVRKLAERTGTATKEIEEIIMSLQQESEQAESAMTDAVKMVEQGTKMGQESLTILDRIIESSENILASATNVATAITQENATIEEVSGNVTSISQATQNSVVSVEEVAKISEELARQANNLTSLINKFKT